MIISIFFKRGIFPLLFLFLFLFFFGIKEDVRAYTTTTCAFSHATSFDSYSSGIKTAMLNKSGQITASFNGLPYNLINYPGYTNYDGYFYFNGQWNKMDWNGMFLFFNNVTIPVGNSCLAAYLTPKPGITGESYYCTGEAWVYSEESIQTQAGWISSPQTASAFNYYASPEIKSPTGKNIAGLSYTVNSFTRNSVNSCASYVPDCGFYNFESLGSKDSGITGAGTGKKGYVFREGAEKTSVYFQMFPDLRDNCTSATCYVGGTVGSVDNIKLYTRGSVNPAPACPAPPSPATPTPTPIPRGNLLGRVFVDSNENLQRGASEPFVDASGATYPQVWVTYRSTGISGWPNPNASNTTCCNGTWANCNAVSGPYSLTNLFAGTTYDIKATINQTRPGETWIFSNVLNNWAVSPGTSCSFNNGTPIGGSCNNPECTSVIIPNVSINSGQTSYLWFGIKQAPSTSITPSPTPTTVSSTASWFQVAGGDIYAADNITNPLPVDTDLNQGITETASKGTTYYGGDLNLSSGNAGRNANSGSFPELARYEDVKRWYSGKTIPDLGIGSTLTSADLPEPGSLETPVTYVKELDEGDEVAVSGFDNFTGNAVIFVNGNLKIDSDITVVPGSFLGFVVSGDITVSEDVGTSQSDTDPNIEGFYLTNGMLNTSLGANPSVSRLNLSGTFVADEVNLQRQLTGGGSQNYPAETFSYRPDFSFTAPAELRHPYRYWQETAP